MTSFDELPKAYATLRFAGDELDPADISALLPVAPKRAHRKGEIFYAGPQAGTLAGRTGIWYFDTRDLASRDLADHLRCIVKLLYPEPGNVDRVNNLREVMGRKHATADVSCFGLTSAARRLRPYPTTSARRWPACPPKSKPISIRPGRAGQVPTRPASAIRGKLLSRLNTGNARA